MNMNVYLDNAATTPLSSATKNYLKTILDNYGNPSSIYGIGKSAKQIVSDARETAAKFINAPSENIYFTPGGSASNTLAVQGYWNSHNRCHILYSPIAHKSIIKCVLEKPYSHAIKVDGSGFLDFDDLREWLENDLRNSRTPFVVIDYANSELGTIQDVKKLVNLVHFYHGVTYLDCTGSIPTIKLDVANCGFKVDMVGFSAHKLGGLKGCGVLYKSPDIELTPLVFGNQESGLIGGTENVLGIASLGVALKNYDYAGISPENRDYVYDYIMTNIPDSYLVGADLDHRLPHNLYVCFERVDGESLVYALDLAGIQVSTGSACNSQSIVDSSTLVAIGFNKEDMRSCIRMTFSGSETKEELDYVCEKLKRCVEQLRSLKATFVDGNKDWFNDGN